MNGVSIDVRQDDRTVTITVAGELDVDTTPALEAALVAPDVDSVRLDMSGVTFIDSMGLRAVLLTHRRTQLVVVDPSPEVRRIFEIAGVADVLTVADRPT